MKNWYSTTQAAVWMSGALVSFVAMALAGRQLSASMDTFQILFFRSACSLAIVSILLWHSGWHQLATRRFGVHALRNIFHFGGQFGWFYGIAFIPLAEVFAIEFTAPIWTTIFAAVILREKLTATRAIAVAAGLVGVLIILQPGSEIIHPAALAVLLGAVSYALAYTMTKKFSSTESPLAILFYMALIQLPIGLIPNLANFTIPAFKNWPFILIVGTTALTANYCITKALSLADAAVVVPMDFLRLPIIALIGVYFYGERSHYGVFIGAMLIFSGILFNLFMERKKANIRKSIVLTKA